MKRGSRGRIEWINIKFYEWRQICYLLQPKGTHVVQDQEHPTIQNQASAINLLSEEGLACLLAEFPTPLIALRSV